MIGMDKMGNSDDGTGSEKQAIPHLLPKKTLCCELQESVMF